ncbi:ABC transporter permease [Roseibium sp.]|uniref:ABC transporter permease n=1 Tax=Roseibium sp. TaxID=1936156 RepID=UPI003511409B
MAMLSTASETAPRLSKEEKRENRLTRINRIAVYLEVVGLGFAVPLLRILAGDSIRPQLQALWQTLVVPLIGITAFLFAWAALAPLVQTSLGAIPGPAAVMEQAGVLIEDHFDERRKADAFYERQDERNAAYAAAGQEERVKYRTYTGKPTFFDQIVTSLQTVALGFLVATFFAVPVGIMCGLSPLVNGALNPLIQIFKPVSPLAWLPIVTMIISAAYAGGDGAFSKSMLISALTVTLCSLWPTLINTALGVSSIDRDLINVGKVLQLSQFTTIRKVVLPSALPLIFTGLRLSLGVGWMVLIAAEMLAQNPGLGKFVWDEFQNGSSDSLARIMVAVVTIGLIGFFLDRVMYALQAAFTFSAQR